MSFTVEQAVKGLELGPGHFHDAYYTDVETIVRRLGETMGHWPRTAVEEAIATILYSAKVGIRAHEKRGGETTTPDPMVYTGGTRGAGQAEPSLTIMHRIRDELVPALREQCAVIPEPVDVLTGLPPLTLDNEWRGRWGVWEIAERNDPGLADAAGNAFIEEVAREFMYGQVPNPWMAMDRVFGILSMGEALVSPCGKVFALAAARRLLYECQYDTSLRLAFEQYTSSLEQSHVGAARRIMAEAQASATTTPSVELF